MKLLKRVIEARPVVQDPDWFWTAVGEWLTIPEVDEIFEEAVEQEQATVIRSTDDNDGWIVSLGGGRVYEVEVAHRCPFCKAELFYDETDDSGICLDYSCQKEWAAELNAGY